MPSGACALMPDNPPVFSDCMLMYGTAKPCCVFGNLGNELLQCRPNCSACQKGLSSNDCCISAAGIGACSGSTPFCCKLHNGNDGQFGCVADPSECPS